MKYLFLFIPVFVFGQFVSSSTPIAVNSTNPNAVSNVVSFYQLSEIPNENVKGYPYYFKEWKPGYIVTLNGLSLKFDKILFDIEKNRVIVESNVSNDKVVLYNKNIVGFYIDNASKDTRYFKKISPLEFNSYDYSNKDTRFYEIFHTSSDNLIKDSKKIILNPKNNLGYSSYSGLPLKKYKKTSSYFIKKNDEKYYKCKLTRKNILKLLSEKEKELSLFVKKHNLSYSKELDVVKIVDYYHSLK